MKKITHLACSFVLFLIAIPAFAANEYYYHDPFAGSYNNGYYIAPAPNYTDYSYNYNPNIYHTPEYSLPYFPIDDPEMYSDEHAGYGFANGYFTSAFTKEFAKEIYYEGDSVRLKNGFVRETASQGEMIKFRDRNRPDAGIYGMYIANMTDAVYKNPCPGNIYNEQHTACNANVLVEQPATVTVYIAQYSNSGRVISRRVYTINTDTLLPIRLSGYTLQFTRIYKGFVGFTISRAEIIDTEQG